MPDEKKTSWTLEEDGEYNEQSLTIGEHKVTIFSDRDGVVWSWRYDGADFMQSLVAKTVETARQEALHNALHLGMGR